MFGRAIEDGHTTKVQVPFGLTGGETRGTAWCDGRRACSDQAGKRQRRNPLATRQQARGRIALIDVADWWRSALSDPSSRRLAAVGGSGPGRISHPPQAVPQLVIDLALGDDQTPGTGTPLAYINLFSARTLGPGSGCQW